jgi:nucleoside-diphosphate-sugar epimerase
MAIAQETMRGQIYNVGLSSANVSKRELCDIIKTYVPRFEIVEAEIGKDKDQRNYVVSNKKIELEGFEPNYNLSNGIQELLKGFTMIKNTKYGNV